METTSEKAFHAYGTKMRAVMELKYLGRVMKNTDDDWPAVAGNIRMARAIWGRLARILGREGVDPKVSQQYRDCVTLLGPPPPGPESLPAFPRSPAPS